MFNTSVNLILYAGSFLSILLTKSKARVRKKYKKRNLKNKVLSSFKVNGGNLKFIWLSLFSIVRVSDVSA